MLLQGFLEVEGSGLGGGGWLTVCLENDVRF